MVLNTGQRPLESCIIIYYKYYGTGVSWYLNFALWLVSPPINILDILDIFLFVIILLILIDFVHDSLWI